MADDGMHEIQLNGKQLIFLFMTATVVAVVIFLCGLMVGRGVRAPGGGTTAVATSGITTDPTADAAPSTSAVGTTEALTYPDRLDAPAPPPESLRENDEPVAVPAPAPVSASAPAPASVAAREREQPRPTAPPAAKVAETASTEPAGSGYVVQVASVNRRAEADTIAKRLATKGYPSFVTTFGSGQSMKYRVRVGKYTDRQQAETISTKLKSEEQFNPWITR